MGKAWRNETKFGSLDEALLQFVLQHCIKELQVTYSLEIDLHNT